MSAGFGGFRPRVPGVGLPPVPAGGAAPLPKPTTYGGGITGSGVASGLPSGDSAARVQVGPKVTTYGGGITGTGVAATGPVDTPRWSPGGATGTRASDLGGAPSGPMGAKGITSIGGVDVSGAYGAKPAATVSRTGSTTTYGNGMTGSGVAQAADTSAALVPSKEGYWHGDYMARLFGGDPTTGPNRRLAALEGLLGQVPSQTIEARGIGDPQSRYAQGDDLYQYAQGDVLGRLEQQAQTGLDDAERRFAEGQLGQAQQVGRSQAAGAARAMQRGGARDASAMAALEAMASQGAIGRQSMGEMGIQGMNEERQASALGAMQDLSQQRQQDEFAMNAARAQAADRANQFNIDEQNRVAMANQALQQQGFENRRAGFDALMSLMNQLQSERDAHAGTEENITNFLSDISPGNW